MAPFGTVICYHHYYKTKSQKCTGFFRNFRIKNSCVKIFALQDEKNEAKTRKNEEKRDIRKGNQKFEKIFEKPLDKGIFLWYNLTRSAKEIGWCRTKNAASITITYLYHNQGKDAKHSQQTVEGAIFACPIRDQTGNRTKNQVLFWCL